MTLNQIGEGKRKFPQRNVRQGINKIRQFFSIKGV